MVIGELIDTEQRYIQNLEILLNVYLPELEHVVAPRDLRLLFPAQLEPLLERHRELLGRLEERAREGSQFLGIVGDIFGQLCDGGNVSKGVQRNFCGLCEQLEGVPGRTCKALNSSC